MKEINEQQLSFVCGGCMYYLVNSDDQTIHHVSIAHKEMVTYIENEIANGMNFDRFYVVTHA